MIESLIKIIRSDLIPDAREKLSVELAKSGSDWATLELIRMAEGKLRRKSKYGKLFYRFYSEDDQINAISALGETKNKLALDYLKKIYYSKDSEEIVPEYPKTKSLENIESIEIVTTHEYINAPKNLKKLLDYKEVSNPFTEQYSINMDSIIHHEFINSISQLEVDLNLI